MEFSARSLTLLMKRLAWYLNAILLVTISLGVVNANNIGEINCLSPTTSHRGH